MSGFDPADAEPTPYERSLRRAHETARLGRNQEVRQLLDAMLAARAAGRYADLPLLWERLPPVYQAVTGRPPRDRADDS